MDSPSSGVRLAVVGLGFGAAFAPIYQRHPDVQQVVLCDPDPGRLSRVGASLGIPEADQCRDLAAVLRRDEIDAVHLLTPVPFHAEQAVAVLEAGKHCACAVPMATTLEDLRRILAAQRASGKIYMLMETAVYSREFFYVQDLLERGILGNLTFLRGTYYQDLEGSYPLYWRAQPPMHYATHALSPLLALAKTHAESVCCLGSGRLRSDLQQPDGNVFPLQTALFRLAGTTTAAEVTRSWFQVARPYTEAFSAYGDRCGFEWQQVEDELPLLYTLEPRSPEQRGRHVTAVRVSPPDRPELLPESIAPYTQKGHGGSHPHLAHAFVRSIVEGRPAAIDAVTGANWTAAGICANDSALRDGERVLVPDFGKDG